MLFPFSILLHLLCGRAATYIELTFQIGLRTQHCVFFHFQTTLTKTTQNPEMQYRERNAKWMRKKYSAHVCVDDWWERGRKTLKFNDENENIRVAGILDWVYSANIYIYTHIILQLEKNIKRVSVHKKVYVVARLLSRVQYMYISDIIVCAQCALMRMRENWYGMVIHMHKISFFSNKWKYTLAYNNGAHKKAIEREIKRLSRMRVEKKFIPRDSHLHDLPSANINKMTFFFLLNSVLVFVFAINLPPSAPTYPSLL